jgi:hypothetical protein
VTKWHNAIVVFIRLTSNYSALFSKNVLSLWHVFELSTLKSYGHMKHFNSIHSTVTRMTLSLLMGLLFLGCSRTTEQEEKQPNAVRGVVHMGESKVVDSIQQNPKDSPSKKGEPCFSPGSRGNNHPNLDEYVSMIETDEELQLDKEGCLYVWIGPEKNMPKPNQKTIRDTTSWHTTYSTNLYARITPSVDDFLIDPEGPVIIRIDTTGSGYGFTIKPEKLGQKQVYANIELFYNKECTGIAITSQPTQRLHVKVQVSADNIWTESWEKLQHFIIALVALLLGALFFVIRKYVMRKTGYGLKETESTNVENADIVSHEEDIKMIEEEKLPE